MEEIEAYMSVKILKCIMVLVVMIFLSIRLWIIERNCEILFEAIFKYRIHCRMVATIPMVNYDTVTPIWIIIRNVFRFWDWGYEHYLTPYDYRLIKPYIVDKRKEIKK